jgi:TonB family protein
MLLQSKEDKISFNRLLLSSLLAFILHLILLLAGFFFLQIHVPEPEPYTGPLYIELEDFPVLEQPAQETTEDKPITKDKPPLQEKPKSDNTSKLDTTPKEEDSTEQKTLTEQKESSHQQEEPVISKEPPRIEDPKYFINIPETDNSLITEPDESLTTETEEKEESALDMDSLLALDELLNEQTGQESTDSLQDDTSEQYDEIMGEEDMSNIFLKWEDTQNRVPVYIVRPVVPDWVARQGLSLKVVVTFVLTPQGFLMTFVVKESSGYTDVDNAVIEALRKWRFKVTNVLKNIKGEIAFFIQPQW